MATPQPDFLRPVRGTPPRAWVACALAAAGLLLAVADAASAWQARAAALARQQEQQARAQALRTPPPVTAPTPEQKAVRAALVRLQRPWADHFAAIDALAQPGVAWLALDIGDGGRLRLEGQAPDDAAALAAADALRASGRVADVLLGRVERAADGSRRFELGGQAGAAR